MKSRVAGTGRRQISVDLIIEVGGMVPGLLIFIGFPCQLILGVNYHAGEAAKATWWDDDRGVKNTEPGFLLFYRVASYEVALVNEVPRGYKVLLRRSPGLCLPMMDNLSLFFAIIRIDGLVYHDHHS